MSPAGAISHLNVADGSVTEIGPIPPADHVTTDGRYLLAAREGSVTVVDSGAWTWSHGDHFHYYSARTGIRVTDASGAEIAVSDECPSVHGEGTAQGEAVVVGCEDGALVYRDGTITKLDSPDAFGRIGNAYVSEDSPLVVMDYKDDPDAEGYLLHRLDGDALLLGSDGNLHVIDPATGEVTASHEAIAPWQSPAEWQDEHPATALAGDVVYVTDAAQQRIVALDAHTGEQLRSAALPVTPNEIVAVG